MGRRGRSDRLTDSKGSSHSVGSFRDWSNPQNSKLPDFACTRILSVSCSSVQARFATMRRHVLLSTLLGALGSQIMPQPQTGQIKETTLGAAVGGSPHQHFRHGWGRHETRTAEACRTLHLRGAGLANAGGEEGDQAGGTDDIPGEGCPCGQRLMLAWNLHHEYRGLHVSRRWGCSHLRLLSLRTCSV